MYQGGVTIWIDQSIPGGISGNWYDRIHDAYVEWQGVCCVDQFTFIQGSPAVNATYPNCYAPPYDAIMYYEDFSGPATGITDACMNTQTGKIDFMMTRFDSSKPWYAGTGNVPNDKYDVYGVATHELGHVTGTWQGANPHFIDGSADCPGGLGDQTMCPVLGLGQGKWQSLEEHDKYAFKDNY